MIENLCTHITESASFQESRRRLREGARTLKLHGLSGALKAFWIATTYREVGFPRFHLVPTLLRGNVGSRRSASQTQPTKELRVLCAFFANFAVKGRK